MHNVQTVVQFRPLIATKSTPKRKNWTRGISVPILEERASYRAVDFQIKETWYNISSQQCTYLRSSRYAVNKVNYILFCVRTKDLFIYVTVFCICFFLLNLCHELLDYIIIRFGLIKGTITKQFKKLFKISPDTTY